MLLAPLPAIAQKTNIDQIVIRSTWGGLGKPDSSELTITHKGSGYSVAGRTINAQLIQDLIDAVNEPAVSKPDLGNLGITRDWLEKNAKLGAADYGKDYILTAALNQQNLFFASYNDTTFIEKLLPSMFQEEGLRWTDDYPQIEIRLQTHSGKWINFSSDAQPLFMLPWKIETEGATFKTYNAHISRALAKLLPNKFTNRERIEGEGLRGVLATAVMREIEDDWKRLDAENKAGTDIDRLRRKFRVSNLEINNYHNVEYGVEWKKGNPNETNLHASLRAPGFPKNFFIGLVLPVRTNTVENVELFLNNIDRYRQLVESVPWLKTFLAGHFTLSVELKFVADCSLSDKAMRMFAADMELVGKEALVTQIASRQKEIALILVGRTYSQAYWLVLPDKTMVLWRFSADDSLLKWTRHDFTLGNCADYQSNSSQCAGALISAAGEIVSK